MPGRSGAGRGWVPLVEVSIDFTVRGKGRGSSGLLCLGRGSWWGCGGYSPMVSSTSSAQEPPPNATDNQLATWSKDRTARATSGAVDTAAGGDESLTRVVQEVVQRHGLSLLLFGRCGGDVSFELHMHAGGGGGPEGCRTWPPRRPAASGRNSPMIAVFREVHAQRCGDRCA